MKVWIVFEPTDNHPRFLGVYSTEGKAQEVADEITKKNTIEDICYSEAYVVDMDVED